MQRNDATQAVLSKLLAEHRLEPATRLYREALRKSLTSTGSPGVYRLEANASPVESVVDVYGPGYVVQAEQVGPGLAFAETATPNWQETMELRALRALGNTVEHAAADRVEVEIRIEDVLRQGGLVYPVESVTTERAWYCTLPSGSIEVREVS
jgi:hypothetical protein